MARNPENVFGNALKPVALALLVVLLAACSAGAPTATTSGATATPTPTKVRISHAGVTIFRLPFYVAIQNGYFSEEGIDLEVVDTTSGSDAMKMLAGNAVEFSTGQLLDAVNLNKQGIHVQGVAMLTNKLSNSIIVRKALADQVKSMKDLTGQNHTIGVTSVGSGTWQFAVYVASRDNVPADDLNFVSVGSSGASVLGAFKAGRVDAMSFGDPENFELVDSGDGAFLIDMTDAATHARVIGDTYLNNQIMVSEAYMTAHPEVVQHFVNAIQKGLNWTNAHQPDAVGQLIIGFPGFNGMDQPALMKSLQRGAHSVPPVSVITQDAFDNAMKLPLAIGAISEAIPFSQLVNNTFAEQAAKLYPPSTS